MPQHDPVALGEADADVADKVLFRLNVTLMYKYTSHPDAESHSLWSALHGALFFGGPVLIVAQQRLRYAGRPTPMVGP